MPIKMYQKMKNLSQRLVNFIHGEDLAMKYIGLWSELSAQTVSNIRYRLTWPNWETTYKLDAILVANGY
jgi:hypothetical protein